jgi:pimeloyl-ACP methyl ester carboxylesterase
MPIVPPLARVVAYDRAGIGASDPVTPLTLASMVDDLIAVISAAGNPPCILVGHSLGGVLAQLAALRRPELVAGMVLVDPAEEQYLAALPAEELQEGITLGESVISQHADGTLPGTVRGAFAGHAQHLTDDPHLRDLILDAYVSCYATPSQARMIRDEHQLAVTSLRQIRRLRAEGTLPDVPVVVLSATTGPSNSGDSGRATTLSSQRLSGRGSTSCSKTLATPSTRNEPQTSAHRSRAS